jgi:hypothetical protein
MTTADELERLRRIEKIVRRAREGGHADLLAEATHLLARLIPASQDQTAEPATRHTAPDPMRGARTRARGDDPLDAEREAEGLHRLRRGRDQCGATTRDGGRCKAPAIAGGLVCRRHGGAAPQVALAAEYTENLGAAYAARQAYEEARGTPGEFDALCRALDAERGLEAYQIKLRILRDLKAGRTRQNHNDPPAITV